MLSFGGINGVERLCPQVWSMLIVDRAARANQRAMFHHALGDWLTNGIAGGLPNLPIQ